jgi:hypothetical protein
MTSQLQPTLLQIRFVGPQLDTRRIPIYELAQVLTATQSIFNKTYLLSQDRFRGRVALRDAERQRLSLQLAGSRRGSDIYDLIPSLGDNNTRTLLETISLSAVEALDRYSYNNVLPINETATQTLQQNNDTDNLQAILVDLRENIVEYFSTSDLKDLCFDLAIDYDSLPGDAKSDKSREIIVYMKKHNRLEQLINYCTRLRPHMKLNLQSTSSWTKNSQPVGNQNASLLAIVILAEAMKLVQRINTKTGIDSIEFQAPFTQIDGATISESTREYVKQLPKVEALGDIQNIHGTITKLDLEANSIELVLREGGRMPVFFNNIEFERLRANAKRGLVLSVTGQPIFNVGGDTLNISGFKAISFDTFQ